MFDDVQTNWLTQIVKQNIQIGILKSLSRGVVLYLKILIWITQTYLILKIFNYSLLFLICRPSYTGECQCSAFQFLDTSNLPTYQNSWAQDVSHRGPSGLSRTLSISNRTKLCLKPMRITLLKLLLVWLRKSSYNPLKKIIALKSGLYSW